MGTFEKSSVPFARGISMSREYDLVILGGGTGGYVAAIRASQLGLSTAIVEQEKLGGTCLHKGCIPSKALLRSAEVYRQTKSASEYGIDTTEIQLNYPAIQKRKENIVEQLHTGVKSLIKKGKIDVYYGKGRILGPSIFSPMAGTISVENNDEENEMLIPKNIIIATGSSPRNLKQIEPDGVKILNSDHALQMDELPRSMMIIGGGVIGIEWASMLADFGVDIKVIEYSDRILPSEDADISKEMEKALKKRGIQIITSAQLLEEKLEITDEGVIATVSVNGVEEVFEADKMFISVGRIGNTKDIGIENTEIELDSSFIKVNEVYQTKEKHIYAIGDVIGGMQLAHVASSEGIAAVEHIAEGTRKSINYQNIARCVYSHPEIASVGLTEEKAKEQGFTLKIGKFPFKAIGKALVYGESDGFVKIIADESTNDILGIHMIGPHVSDMISEAALAMLLDATPWEIGETIHPHPSLSEVIGEAALAVDGKALHF